MSESGDTELQQNSTKVIQGCFFMEFESFRAYHGSSFAYLCMSKNTDLIKPDSNLIATHVTFNSFTLYDSNTRCST